MVFSMKVTRKYVMGNIRSIYVKVLRQGLITSLLVVNVGHMFLPEYPCLPLHLFVPGQFEYRWSNELVDWHWTPKALSIELYRMINQSSVFSWLKDGRDLGSNHNLDDLKLPKSRIWIFLCSMSWHFKTHQSFVNHKSFLNMTPFELWFKWLCI